MALEPGRRLAHYEVLGLLGAGGMGEVYRARDTTLGRHVALKVLPAELEQNEERLARFELEARLLAQLNHPNVATLHGFEDDGGKRFLVMELVDGQTLAERIAQGPIRVDDAIPLFVQIAEALEAAHSKGIIHRDLKPANVKLGPGGKVKLLDFGLAKAFEAPAVELSPESPTVEREETEARAVLGTVPYMSPEQLLGSTVDQRSDIWAYGCVLCEALTGRHPFAADTRSATVQRILNDEPDWNRLPASPPLRKLLRRTLAKDPSDRLHHIADARIELQEIASDLTHPAPVASVSATRRRALRLVPWLVVFGALAALVAQRNRAPSRGDPATERLMLRTDPLVIGDHPGSPIIAISPDGSRVVYAGERAGAQGLFFRELDSYEATFIPGTENAEAPFFSHDGEWLAFVMEGKLVKKSLRGGPVLTICEAPDVHGASWSANDRIAFGLGEHKGVSWVAAGGGKPEALTHVDPSRGREETWHIYPTLLPDGKALLFTTVDDGGGAPRLWAYSLTTGERRMLLEGGNARYVPTGHLVFPRASALWAVRFDPERLEIQGEPTIVVEGLTMGFTMEPAIGHYDIAENGTLVYLGGELTAGRATLVSVSRSGEVEPLTDARHRHLGPRVSPDGRRIAVRMPDSRGEMQVWIYDRGRDAFSQLTTAGANWWPVWAPDGSRIFYPSVTSGATVDIHAISVDGSGRPTKLTTGGDSDQPYSMWGDWLFFHRSRERFGIWTLSLSGGTEQALFDAAANRFHPAISPDGRWLAYSSDEKSSELDTEIYVTAFPGLGAKWQVSEAGGRAPVWSRDGSEIYFEGGPAYEGYNDGAVEIMAAGWNTESEVAPGKPKLLFRGDFLSSSAFGRNYDVLPDDRFLMLKPDREAPPPAELHVIRNWVAELERLVPTGR